ncbi:MAG: hypothetical protein PHD88_03825 [Firmicutes bacterium]|nr:hypothetical protein [Bacillota bacterium]MDD4263479.1 hypothetical protein [Bacillota bacterium]MDD4693520.1 hypothetical protein [Bacillota bacterium]
MLQEEKEWVQIVSERTKERVLDVMIQRAVITGSTKIQVTYDDLAKLSGLSKGAIFKAVKALEAESKIKKLPSRARRIPNVYEIYTNVEIPEPAIAETVELPEYLEMTRTLKTKLRRLEQENLELKQILFPDIRKSPDIISRSQITDDTVMLVFKVPKISDFDSF